MNTNNCAPGDNNFVGIAYQEVCNSYQKIDDFRAKLLGLLPLASTGGIFLLLNTDLSSGTFSLYTEQIVLVVGLFGAIVTVVLFLYELRGIEKCSHLVEMGKCLENFMKVPNGGQFNLLYSNHRWWGKHLFASVIYPLAAGAWVYTALVLYCSKLSLIISGGITAMGILIAFFTINCIIISANG